MDLLTTIFLAGTGVVAGVIAAMVGGAAVVIYPALIATGVSPQLSGGMQSRFHHAGDHAGGAG